MNKALLVLLAASSAFAQTAQFPSAIASDSHLKIAGNFVQSTLVGSIAAGDTLITVRDSSRISANMLLTIDTEVVSVTSKSGNNLTVVRGFDLTTAASHASGARVYSVPTAWDKNVLSAEIKAIQSALGVGLVNVSGNSGAILMTSYAWSPQTPGGSLIVGANTITLSPVPQGVNGTNVGHYYWVAGGTGTAEACLGIGGTAIAGGVSGTLIIQCANTHSGAWTIGPATAGLQEAIYSVSADYAATIVVPPTSNNFGYHLLYAPVYIPTAGRTVNNGRLTIAGAAGRMTSRFRVPQALPAASTGVFVHESCNGCLASEFRDLVIDFVQPDSASLASYIHHPPAIMADGTFELTIRNAQIARAWKGISLKGTYSGGTWTKRVGQVVIDTLHMSTFDRGIDIDGALDSIRIHNLHFWPWFYLSANQLTAFYANTEPAIRFGRMDSFAISDSLFINKKALLFAAGADSGSAFGTIVNTHFDTYANVQIDVGEIQVSNSYSTLASTCAAPAFLVSNGRLSISNHWFYADQCNQNFVQIAGTTAAYNAMMTVSGSRFSRSDGSSASLTPPDISIARSSGIGTFQSSITGNTFYREPTKTWTSPFVSCATAEYPCAVTGNIVSPKTTGSGNFISIGADGWHVVWANSFYGWGASFPASKALGKYEDGSVKYDMIITAPTSCSGQPSGKIWNDAGDLKACP